MIVEVGQSKKRRVDPRRRLRSSLRYVSHNGAISYLIPWPLAYVQVSGEVLELHAGRFGFHGSLFPGPPFFLKLDTLKKIERTQNGVRIFVLGLDDPIVIASLFRRTFLRKLQENGIKIPDSPIIRSTWLKL